MPSKPPSGNIPGGSISQIAGNAPDNVKMMVANSPALLGSQKTFASDIFTRLIVTEVSIRPKAEEPGRMEGRVVCEIVVEGDMLNAGGNVHGACSALLVDNCSTMALIALNLVTTGEPLPGVSQSLNMVYHSPAPAGVKLRIVNTTIAVGGRTMSMETEVWNATDHRLVATGVHIKMQPTIKPGL